MDLRICCIRCRDAGTDCTWIYGLYKKEKVKVKKRNVKYIESIIKR